MDKSKKKILSGTFISLVVLTILGLLFNAIDTKRISKQEKPIFTINIYGKDGDKITYWGLGYKIISYPKISPSEPFKNHTSKKGSWFMKFDKPNQEMEVKHSKRIDSIDEFYNISLTKNKDIRDLPKEYKVDNALKDEVYVNTISLENVEEFLKDYKNEKSVYLRTAKTTKEGDLLIRDVLYYAPTKQLLVVMDNSRDSYAATEGERIFLIEYDNTRIIEDGNGKKWVIYKGDKYNPSTSSYISLVISEIEK